MMYIVVYAKIVEQEGQYAIDGPYIGATKETKELAEEAARGIVAKTSKSNIPIVEVYCMSENTIVEAKDKMCAKADRVLSNIFESQKSAERKKR